MAILRTGIMVVTGAAAILFVQQKVDLLALTARGNSGLPNLSFTSPAQAAPRYVPRSGGKAPRRTQGTGSRGCNNKSAQVSLTLLVPQTHAGLTTSGRPTFAWYLSQPTSVPVEFVLTKAGTPNPIYEKQFSKSAAGITELTLPQDLPELAPGEYSWTVAIVCNPQRRSNDVIAKAWIERVAAPPTLAKKLAAVTSANQKAEVYAAQGYWYDALRVLSAARAQNPKDESLLQDRLSLLKQIQLPEVVEQETRRLSASQNSGS